MIKAIIDPAGVEKWRARSTCPNGLQHLNGKPS